MVKEAAFMSVYRIKDSTTGIEYGYEQESYFDEEKQAYRSKKTYLGRYDPKTGEYVKIGKRGRKKKDDSDLSTAPVQSAKDSDLQKLINEKDRKIKDLEKQISALEKEKAQLSDMLIRLGESLMA